MRSKTLAEHSGADLIGRSRFLNLDDEDLVEVLVACEQVERIRRAHRQAVRIDIETGAVAGFRNPEKTYTDRSRCYY